jgi:hypothetical protein
VDVRVDGLRRGDLAEVRSPSEILATLDDGGMLEQLPFMPEMLPYIGRRFVVAKRADKVCDTICGTGSRRLPDTVLLEDLRCDGSGHDGCQAECRIFWKEAWLRRVEPSDPRPPVDVEALDRLARLARKHTKRKPRIDGQPTECYTCQNTELFRASPQHLPSWDPRPYVEEYRSGNVGLGRFLRVMARVVVFEPLRKLGIRQYVPVRGPGGSSTRRSALGLQPGDLVRVKSKEEIAATLAPDGRNRGLSFDREMMAYCGGTYRVRQRVRRFIDEARAQMVELKTDAVTLDDVVCSGEHSMIRWFCPRGIYPYWRESWLQRVAQPPVGAPAEPRMGEVGPTASGTGTPVSTASSS